MSGTRRSASPAHRDGAGPRVTLFTGLAAAFLLAVIVIRYAEPIQDGDLFWHMAYARQMIERATLRLDHTSFSWTPASNDTLYNAWASQLLFRGLWEGLGPWSLFALRYLVIVGVLALLWGYARRLGLGRSILTALVLLVVALASYGGTLIKPELFSLLFMHLVVWAYARARLARDRGQDPVPWFYLVPLVMLAWVNHHGGFILAGPFLALTAVGEGLNRVWSPGLALSRRAYSHLLAAWALSGAATAINPYGLRYPLQLFADYALVRTPRPDVEWNAAHQSIFSGAGLAMHFVDYLVIMAAVLGVLVARRAAASPRGARVDWALVLANLGYVPLYAVYLRSTYFWPVIWGYSTLVTLHAIRVAGLPAKPGWLDHPRRRRALVEVAVALFLGLGVRAGYDALVAPYRSSWAGFGISYGNPVPEAEFLARQRLGPRTYNIFDSGGYLLWRLYPHYRVMTDSRSFPYLGWFQDQYDFTVGRSFEAFLEKYPADVAVIDLVKTDCVRNFQRSPAWRLAYYGPTAAVFVRAGVALQDGAAAVSPDRFSRMSNARAALQVFDFARDVGDFATAWLVLEQLETRLRRQAPTDALEAAVAYRGAHRAIRAEDYRDARTLFDRAFRSQSPGDRDRQIQELLEQMIGFGSLKGSPAALAARAALEQHTLR